MSRTVLLSKPVFFSALRGETRMLTREEVERIEATLQLDAKTLLREYRTAMDERDQWKRQCEAEGQAHYLTQAERDALVAEGRLLREAVEHLARSVGENYPPEIDLAYETAVSVLTKATPLITAEVARVRRLEAVLEAAEAQDPPASANLARALAAYRTGVASIVWTSPDEGNNWTIRVRYRESDG